MQKCIRSTTLQTPSKGRSKRIRRIEKKNKKTSVAPKPSYRHHRQKKTSLLPISMRSHALPVKFCSDQSNTANTSFWVLSLVLFSPTSQILLGYQEKCSSKKE